MIKVIVFILRGKELLFLNKRHRRQQHQGDRCTEHDCQKYRQKHKISPASFI